MAHDTNMFQIGQENVDTRAEFWERVSSNQTAHQGRRKARIRLEIEIELNWKLTNQKKENLWLRANFTNVG